MEDKGFNASQMIMFVLGTFENIEGKEENAGNQHFLLLPQCFQNPSTKQVVKVRENSVKGRNLMEISLNYVILHI